jgi:hypothetical protein
MSYFEARYSASRLGLQVLFAVMIVGIGAAVHEMTPAQLWLKPGEQPVVFAARFGISAEDLGRGFGWGVIGIGCAVILMAIHNSRFKGPVASITEEGLYWYRWSDAIIPWSNIEQIKVETFTRSPVVKLWLRDRRISPPRRWFRPMDPISRLIGYGDMVISLAGTNKSIEDFIGALESCKKSA